MIRRREFITLVGGVAAVSWPLAARAQQPGKIWRIGFLSGAARPVLLETSQWGGFLQGMRELGLIEDKDFIVEWRFAEGRTELFPMLAAELVRAQVDVVVVGTTGSIRAVQQASRTIPIVMAVSTDPVGTGFVESLARPGGNLTGLLQYEAGITGKWLAMLKEITPSIAHAALVLNPKTSTAMTTSCGRPRPRLRPSRSSLCPNRSRPPLTSSAPSNSFARDAEQRPARAAGYHDLLHRDLIIALAARHRLPAVYAPVFSSRPAVSCPMGPTRPRYFGRRHLCRPHPARRQSRRPSGAGTDQVSSPSSTSNGEGARSDRAARPARSPPTR